MASEPTLEQLKAELAIASKRVQELSITIEARLSERVRDLETREQAMSDLQTLMEENAAKAKAKVVLDVGGKRFAVSKDTLLAHKDSFFSTMIQSGSWEPDEDGAYFIDRNGKNFSIILEYLRSGNLSVGKLTEDKLKSLQSDLDFYHIPASVYRPTEVAVVQEPVVENLKLTFVQSGDSGLLFANGCSTVTKVGLTQGSTPVFGSLGWAAGWHEWKIKIEKIVGSYWVAIGVGTETTKNYTSMWGLSSQNEVYRGEGNVSRSTASGDWQSGDIIRVWADFNLHRLIITNMRTRRAQEITGLPNETLYPFFDIFMPALAISFV